MTRTWTHVGQLWTNGESFLALDADLLPHWRGLSDNTYQDVVVGLSHEDTTIPVGPGVAGVVMTDPEVGDEGWLEVFRSDDAVAVVQASPDEDDAYGAMVAAALRHPEVDDDKGDVVRVDGGRLVLLSAALDGEGDGSPALRRTSAEPVPDTWPDLGDDDELAALVLDVEPGAFRVRVRWFSEVEGGAFARCLLVRERSD